MSSALTKRLDRRRERRDYIAALSRHSESDSSVSSADDESISDQPDPCDHFVRFADDDQYLSASDSNNSAYVGRQASYTPDDNDNMHSDVRTLEQSKDDSLLLYLNADVSTKAGIAAILQFAIECSLSKLHTTKLFDLIRSLLPTPNKLPATQAQLLKLFDRPPGKFLLKVKAVVFPIALPVLLILASSSRYYCNGCSQLIASNDCLHRTCDNPRCMHFQLPLKTRDVSEIVTLDLRSQLESVIRRNWLLLNGDHNLFPASDVSRGEHYIVNNRNFDNSLSINLHVDGAPLVRTTKASLWPFFASVIEIPPPVREYQENILVLALWASSIKPNVGLFLGDCIETLDELRRSPIKFIIDEREVELRINVQLFISDLPAKSLFLDVIGHNGYYACNHCKSEGGLESTSCVCMPSSEKTAGFVDSLALVSLTPWLSFR